MVPSTKNQPSKMGTPTLVNSSFSHVEQPEEKSAINTLEFTQIPDRGESALPEDKREEAMKNLEEDWQDDQANPRNWPFRKKWTAVAVVAMYTFVSPLASSMMAPGLPEIAQKYNITSSTTVAMTLSIFLLAYALGPLFLSPLSEMYGRTWVLHIGNMFSLGFNMGCAYAPNASALIGFRFLAGLSGSAPIACGGGSISDLFSERDRASAMAVYSLGPLIGVSSTRHSNHPGLDLLIIFRTCRWTGRRWLHRSDDWGRIYLYCHSKFLRARRPHRHSIAERNVCPCHPPQASATIG